ncbi:unnamed protein product, partial [Effrenium voratum]
LFDPDLATSHAGSEKMDRISIIRRFHRNLEDELHLLFSKFDFLLMFRENFVTSQFRWMLETVIFVYVVLYPWCVCNESNLVLGATTVGMACVFYGLNALTEQLEDPVHHQTQGFDLRKTFVNLFQESWTEMKLCGSAAVPSSSGTRRRGLQSPRRATPAVRGVHSPGGTAVWAQFSGVHRCFPLGR